MHLPDLYIAEERVLTQIWTPNRSVVLFVLPTLYQGVGRDAVSIQLGVIIGRPVGIYGCSWLQYVPALGLGLIAQSLRLLGNKRLPSSKVAVKAAGCHEETSLITVNSVKLPCSLEQDPFPR